MSPLSGSCSNASCSCSLTVSKLSPSTIIGSAISSVKSCGPTDIGPDQGYGRHLDGKNIVLDRVYGRYLDCQKIVLDKVFERHLDGKNIGSDRVYERQILHWFHPYLSDNTPFLAISVRYYLSDTTCQILLVRYYLSDNASLPILI